MTLTVRFFAAARAAAGTDTSVVDVPSDATLGDLEHILAASYPELVRVLARCSYLRDAVALCDRAAPLGDCTTIDVLPPFAGG